jgi:hypothetical protein
MSVCREGLCGPIRSHLGAPQPKLSCVLLKKPSIIALLPSTIFRLFRPACSYVPGKKAPKSRTWAHRGKRPCSLIGCGHAYHPSREIPEGRSIGVYLQLEHKSRLW